MARITLERRIRRKQFTITEVGRLIGVSRSEVSRWCTGTRRPLVANAIKLAKLLKCRVEDLGLRVSGR